jgi:MFS family permease
MSKSGLFLLSSAMASFITPFISIAVSVALPSIAKSFNIDMASVNWFVNVFLISMASTILLLGVVADWLSKELIFVIGAGIFSATSFSILYTGNFTCLLILRCAQGFGAAMISGTAVAILASLFPKETGLVIGINTTAVYVGTTLGPVLGGFLVNYSGWPALFIFSGAFAFVSAMLALLSLDFSRRSGKRPPRFETLLIFTLSTILTSVGSAHIRSLFGLAALLIGLTTFMFTLHIERRKSLNLVKQIFEKSTFLAYLAALLNYVATYALTILYSNYLQLEAGFTPWEAGLILLAQPIPQALLSSLAGYLSDKWDPGALAATGMGLIALGIGISIVLYKWLSFLIASLILLGTGFAFFASPNTTQIMRKIPKEAFASASSFLGLMRFLGQSLSTSILTATMLAFKTSVPMKESLTVYLIVAVVGASTAAMSAHRKKT